jgi:hypothetical protein
MKNKFSIRLVALFLLLIGLIALWPLRGQIQSQVAPATQRTNTEPEKTVSDRLTQYGEAARARLKPYFDGILQAYPPSKLVFLGIKDERKLQLYVASSNGSSQFLRSYPILAASGVLGPKLSEGDKQVPEGIYQIEWLNPNSSYHLSMRVSYPNDFDRAQAAKEHRTNLGGDIMIHGDALSVGCLAMGDEVSEDLFVLAADTGIENITVLLTPVDFRIKSLPITATNIPVWSDEIYKTLKPKILELPLPPKAR